MNAPERAGSERGLILLAVPRWIVIAGFGSILLNAFATALIATALVLHIAGSLR